MKSNQSVVVKLGGSLMDCIRSLVREISLHAAKRGISVLIVPGGAVFADNIRAFSRHNIVGDEASHWMAVLAMEQYGHYLADRTGTGCTDNPDVKGPGVSILLPYNMLRSGDSGLDHSWDVTSDTISAWVAKKTGRRLIKLTDVDGVFMGGELLPSVYAGELAGMETCVDRALPFYLMEHGMDCLVVNGKYTDRVLLALEGDTGAGTLIMGRASIKPE